MLRTITFLLLISITTKPSSSTNNCDASQFKNIYIDCELHKNEFLQINSTDGLESLHEAFTIYINGQNISNLCRGSVHNFENLVVLELINDNINEIEAGAFKNLGQAKLHLDFNKLKVIRTGVFNGLNIVSLSLTENELEYVEAEAFNDMLRLETVLLSVNRIHNWNGDWFHNTPRLGVINFSFNDIVELPKNSFANINGKHGEFYTNLDLSWNKINQIHREAFGGVTYFGSINLSGNKIHAIPPRLFEGAKKIYELNLIKNNLTCLFSDELVSFKKVSVVKLKLNPLRSRCREFVRKTAEKEKIMIEL